MMYRLRLARVNNLKIKTATRIPAQLVGGDGIGIEKSNGVYTVDLDYSELQVGQSVDSLVEATTFLALWESGEDDFSRISLTNFKAELEDTFDLIYQPLDATLTALAALDSTAGLLAQTGEDTFERRTLTAPAAGITVTDGDGVAGDPTLALANDLAAYEGLSTNGLVARTGDGTATTRTVTAPAAGITVSNGDGVSGNPTLALANDLAALEGLASTGLAARTTTDTWAQRTLTAPAAGLAITNPAGVAGNPTFALANDLAAVEGLASNGVAVRTATDTWTVRTITGTANQITVTNGDGVSGNPTLSIPSNAALPGAPTTTTASPSDNSTKIATTAYVDAQVSGGVAGVSSLNGATGAITSDLGLQNVSLAVSAGSSALTIALKDAAGNDPSAGSPAVFNFRNATGTTGTIASLSVTAATSLVISSGSTLGVTSSTAFRLWVVGFNDAGTFRLGVVNVGGQAGRIYPLMEDIPTNSTAEGGAGAADSAGVFYTGTAVTSKAYRILGYLEWSPSGVTAGTWTTSNLIRVQLFGYGIKKPGEVIQISQMSTSTQTDNSTTSFVATNVALDMALSSAANKVRISYNGGVVGNSTAAAPLVALHRGSAAVTTQIGPYQAHLPAAVAVSIAPLAAEWLDFPNTTSAAYTVGVRSNAGGIVASFPYTGNSNVGIMRLEEIMC